MSCMVCLGKMGDVSATSRRLYSFSRFCELLLMKTMYLTKSLLVRKRLHAACLLRDVAIVGWLHSWQLHMESSVKIMNCAAVCIMLSSKKKFSDPLGMSLLPQRSPSICSKPRSRIWFNEIVMNRKKFDDARYKCFFA